MNLLAKAFFSFFWVKPIVSRDWQVFSYFGFFSNLKDNKKNSIYFPIFYVAIVQKFVQNKNGGSD
jgi:hypothetical protein